MYKIKVDVGWNGLAAAKTLFGDGMVVGCVSTSRNPSAVQFAMEMETFRGGVSLVALLKVS